MRVEILLTYKDDTLVKLAMESSRVESFIKDLHSGSVHINEEAGVGFWTTPDQLRHLIIQRVVDGDTEGNDGAVFTIQKRNEDHSGREDPNEGEGNESA